MAYQEGFPRPKTSCWKKKTNPAHTVDGTRNEAKQGGKLGRWDENTFRGKSGLHRGWGVDGVQHGRALEKWGVLLSATNEERGERGGEG